MLGGRATSGDLKQAVELLRELNDPKKLAAAIEEVQAALEQVEKAQAALVEQQGDVRRFAASVTSRENDAARLLLENQTAAAALREAEVDLARRRAEVEQQSAELTDLATEHDAAHAARMEEVAQRAIDAHNEAEQELYGRRQDLAAREAEVVRREAALDEAEKACQRATAQAIAREKSAAELIEENEAVLKRVREAVA